MNREQKIHKTYVITLLDNKDSVTMSKRAVESCKSKNMDVEIWPAFDGTQQQKIKIPNNLTNQIYINFLKVLNFSLITEEIAVWLSHYSLWCHCLQIDKPIVILEHDAAFIKPYLYHIMPNTIEYLGHEWQQTKKDISCDVNIEGYGYKFMRGCYAYSIDPYVAKNLISNAIKEGITKPLDVFIRSDIFTVTQHDVFAVHKNNNTTLGNRTFFREINQRVAYE